MGIFANLSLFSGVGGLDLAAKWTGRIKTVCYVEKDPYAQGVLMSRFKDKGLDEAPIWNNVSTFNGLPWRGKVDIISGGFPCQDVSFAGKRAGLKRGTRSGLWNHFARIIREIRPQFVLVENVPGLLSLGFGRVLGDLAEMGMDAQWGVWGAGDIGAPHLRKRVWVVAYTKSTGARTNKQGIRCQFERFCSGHSARQMADTAGTRRGEDGDRQSGSKAGWWSVEPNVGRVANGVAFRVDRLRCCGNGVVPQQSLPAWETIVRIADE